ncbi:uncharacterized protein [Aquarana catesbeiana]|uniref:uncharacterized protein n=1 Tax=Aquarana catesbeiana TaxID=8400 RepID=UPI003CC97A7C
MMISGPSLVLFLFLVPMSTEMIRKECGEDIEITTSGGTSEILTAAVLQKYDGTKPKPFLSINETHESSCTENGTFCIQFGDGRRQITLTVHSVTFQDQGKYALYNDTNITEPKIIFIIVTGMCEPKLSSSTDNLTCEVDVANTYKSTIVWMDKHRKIYRLKTFPKNVTEEVVTKLRDTFKLTDETREVDICCTVSYVGKKEEKQNCRIRPSHVGKVEGTADNQNIIILPVLLVLGLAIAVALYISWRRRISFTQKNRERTLSETGLMEDHQAENLEGAPLETLQRPQDQV